MRNFPQAEEVATRRIRDKIAASKKKGMWMGGLPPLGYDVKDRKVISSCSAKMSWRSRSYLSAQM